MELGFCRRLLHLEQESVWEVGKSISGSRLPGFFVCFTDATTGVQYLYWP